MYTLSVIVPIYNVESVLKKCLDSLTKQSLANIQVIMIDDGSTDSSGEIAKSYERRYGNFEYYRKQNGGPSDARNMALNYVKGEYIAFLDSDDWVEDDAYEILYQIAKDYNTDIVFYRVFENEIAGALNYIFPRGGYYNKKQIEEELYPYLLPTLQESGDFRSIRWSNCIRIYRKELIDRYSIRYPKKSRMFEDCYFSFASTVYAQSYYYYNEKPLYHNVAYPGSATRNYMKYMLGSTNALWDGISLIINSDKKLTTIFSKKLNIAGIYFYGRCIENELGNKSMYMRIKKMKEVLKSPQCIDCLHRNTLIYPKGYYPKLFIVMQKRRISSLLYYFYMKPYVHKCKKNLYKIIFRK